MGKDKGMITHQSITWAEHLFSVISSICPATVLSVNATQVQAYKNIFPAVSIIEDNRSLLLNGPLKGIISAHLHYPSEDLLVLACDMIDMKQDILHFLIQQHVKNNAEASVFKNKDRIEPLCGVYSSKGLQKLNGLYQNKLLVKHSMLYALEHINTNHIMLPGHWEFAFKNYNTPEDLALLIWT